MASEVWVILLFKPCFTLALYYASFKHTVHPSGFENKRFPLNTCFLSGLFQTGKVQTKAETIEPNIRQQGSSSKHLFLELPGCVGLLKEI